MEFIDTHCHVQFPDYPLEQGEVISDAREAGVTRMLVVGCSLSDSQAGVEFASQHDGVWSSVGFHPHEASKYVNDHHALQQLYDLAGSPKVVAIGETGLDYYYDNSPREDQRELFGLQLNLSIKHNLPVIFHVRDAFSDFWSIFDEYSSQGTPIKGVVHSFSSNVYDLEQVLSRGLYVGLNGIMTFTKREDQLEAARAVPLNRLLLETDAPFLTPVPFRGKVSEPKYVRTIAEFLANLRGESLDDLASVTTANAKKLFNL